MSEPKYPDISVQMTTLDGNAGAIMGRVTRALKHAGVPMKEISKYRMECMSGDYDNLLQVTMKTVNCD